MTTGMINQVGGHHNNPATEMFSPTFPFSPTVVDVWVKSKNHILTKQLCKKWFWKPCKTVDIAGPNVSMQSSEECPSLGVEMFWDVNESKYSSPMDYQGMPIPGSQHRSFQGHCLCSFGAPWCTTHAISLKSSERCLLWHNTLSIKHILASWPQQLAFPSGASLFTKKSAWNEPEQLDLHSPMMQLNQGLWNTG